MGHPQQPARTPGDVKEGLNPRIQASNSGAQSGGGLYPRRLVLVVIGIVVFVLYSMALVSTFVSTGCQTKKPGPEGPPASCLRGSGAEAVPKADKTLAWEPRPGKYLLSICIYGRATNRIFCLMRSLIAAAFLNRTLIVSPADLCPRANPQDPFRLAVATDLAHLRTCLNIVHGTPKILTISEYLARINSSTVEVDTSFVDRKRQDWTWWCQLPKAIHFKAHTKWDQIPTELTPAQATSLLRTTSQAGVLAMGDLFTFKLQGVPDSPKAISSRCSAILLPPRPILRMATEFIEEFTGNRYASLHLRRTDFQEHCRRKRAQCPHCKVPLCTYQPLTQVAACIGDRMAATGLSALFVASDAPETHLAFLRSLLGLRGITTFQLVGTSLNRSSLEYAMVEKVVCAKAEVFLSQEYSSFSNHISHLRESFRTASCWDGPLCGAQDVPAAS